MENTCSICLDDDYSIDESYITTCQHQFHLKCIRVWFHSNMCCPLCRSIPICGVPNIINNYTIIDDINYRYIMNIIHNYGIKINDYYFIMNILKDNNHIIRNNNYEYMISILNEVVSMNNQYLFNVDYSYPEYSTTYPKYYDYITNEYIEGSFSYVNTLNLKCNIINNNNN